MALLAKLALTENAELEFGMEVFGTTEKPAKIRFVIEGPDYDIACHCEDVGDSIKVKVPKLKGVMPSGVYESRLEVIIDGKIFTPLTESIEFEPLVEFDVTKKKTKSIKEGVKVEAKNVKIIAEDSRETSPKQTGLEKNIQQCIKEGFEVSKVGDNYIMKKGNTYVGIISEKSILKSEKAYSTLTELIDGLSV